MDAVEYRPGSRPSILAAHLSADGVVELIADENGVAWPAGVAVAGGVRPIERQADCAFRAYGELRLGAEKLEEPAPGIDARERGMLLHRALELIWRRLDNYFELKPTSSADRQPMISAAVREAIAYVFRSGVPTELAAAVERERRRLDELVESLLARESTRTPFSVEELEVQREIEIAGARFTLRIDRIDNIEGEGFAILDYKSGAAPTRRWDEEPIRGPQLLAYLLGASDRPVHALANVAVTAGSAKFSGRAMKKNLLPGIRSCLTGKPEAGAEEAEWEKLQQRWIATVQRLAREYLAGRATVQPANDVCRICDLTTLCRRTELAMHVGEAVEEGADE
jgi:RecB family exonuclease